MTNLQRIKSDVYSERQYARREALGQGWKRVKSRGTFLCTADRDGQCWPMREAEEIRWDGTLKQIQAVIEKVEVDHPSVLTVYIAGGFNGYDYGYDYEPSVSSWDVTVWTR